MGRVEKAAVLLRDTARNKVPVWQGPFWGPYKTGKHAGMIWTARDHDNLLKTIRVTKKKDTFTNLSFGLASHMNIWVMCGNYKTWYANQVEYGRGEWKGKKTRHPYLRPAIKQSRADMIRIVENG